MLLLLVLLLLAEHLVEEAKLGLDIAQEGETEKGEGDEDLHCVYRSSRQKCTNEGRETKGLRGYDKSREESRTMYAEGMTAWTNTKIDKWPDPLVAGALSPIRASTHWAGNRDWLARAQLEFSRRAGALTSPRPIVKPIKRARRQPCTHATSSMASALGGPCPGHLQRMYSVRASVDSHAIGAGLARRHQRNRRGPSPRQRQTAGCLPVEEQQRRSQEARSEANRWYVI